MKTIAITSLFFALFVQVALADCGTPPPGVFYVGPKDRVEIRALYIDNEFVGTLVRGNKRAFAWGGNGPGNQSHRYILEVPQDEEGVQINLVGYNEPIAGNTYINEGRVDYIITAGNRTIVRQECRTAHYNWTNGPWRMFDYTLTIRRSRR